MPREIGGAGEGALCKHAEFAADQAAIDRLGDADGAIHAFSDQIDQPVPLPDMKLDVGVAFEEVRQAREQVALREPAVDVDAQRPDRDRLRGSGVRVIDRRQDGEAAAVIVLTLRRERHLAGGTGQQADAEMPLKLLDRL